MSTKSPCIDCITHAICKITFIDFLSDILLVYRSSQSNPKNIPLDVMESIINLTYQLTIREKCSIIENHVRQLTRLSTNEIIKRKEQEDKNSYHYMTQIIYQIMYEAFDIKDIINKELKHGR